MRKVTNFRKRVKKVIKGNLVLPRNAQMLRKKGISNMVVTGEIEFYIPFMGTVAVNETQYACRKNNRKLLARYQQWKDVNIMGNQGQQKKEEIKK